jgi:hypothetical protein
MGETDIAFRHLLRELPDPLLQLAFPRRRLRFLGPLDASADRPRQLTTDTLFRVRDGREECIVHVEVERGWRQDIERPGGSAAPSGGGKSRSRVTRMRPSRAERAQVSSGELRCDAAATPSTRACYSTGHDHGHGESLEMPAVACQMLPGAVCRAILINDSHV